MQGCFKKVKLRLKSTSNVWLTDLVYSCFLYLQFPLDTLIWCDYYYNTWYLICHVLYISVFNMCYSVFPFFTVHLICLLLINNLVHKLYLSKLNFKFWHFKMFRKNSKMHKNKHYQLFPVIESFICEDTYLSKMARSLNYTSEHET